MPSLRWLFAVGITEIILIVLFDHGVSKKPSESSRHNSAHILIQNLFVIHVSIEKETGCLDVV